MALQFLQLLGFIFEGIGLISGIIIATVVLKKDSKYVGNRLMAAAMILLGVYMGSILSYDILYPIFPTQDWIVQGLYRICVIALFFGTMFLFFTIRVMCLSSAWLTKRNTIPYAIIILVYSITIWFIDFLEILPGDQVNTQTKIMIPLYILIAGVAYFIIFSMIGLYRFGIRKSEGLKRMKMVIFFSGLAVSMLAIVINVLSNILADPLGVLDVLFFGTLAIAMVVMTFGFVGRQADPQKEMQIDMHD
ncbi:MAG: hypothetical protein EU530_01485 [Promethearchaeota archaeon]|nr:MAG: hypothetical protein EU530_01485 [Candidatus Lokiarchaeota archaeon]